MHQKEEQTKLEEVCKVFKLSSGDTIICLVTKETQSYVEVEVPYRLSMIQTPHGTANLAMFRWDHTISYDSSIRVYKNSIVAVGDPTSDMITHYSDLMNNIINDSKEDDAEESDSNEKEADEMDSLMKKLLQGFNSDKLH